MRFQPCDVRLGGDVLRYLTIRAELLNDGQKERTAITGLIRECRMAAEVGHHNIVGLLHAAT